MWEAYDLENEDLLWSCINFNGGIGGEGQAPCGAVSASAVCLGLSYRCPQSEKQKAKQARFDARKDAGEVVKSFTEKFGTIICQDLLGVDLSTPEAQRWFQESSLYKEKCDKYVQFVLKKLYELDERRSTAKVPEKVLIYTTPGCPFCAAAKQDLEERSVTHEETSIENNPEALEEVMRLSNGTGIVPVLVSGDEVTVGFGAG